jgi:hypothetical protein
MVLAEHLDAVQMVWLRYKDDFALEGASVLDFASLSSQRTLNMLRFVQDGLPILTSTMKMMKHLI